MLDQDTVVRNPRRTLPSGRLALAVALGCGIATAAAAAQAAPAEVKLPGDRAFPESMTALADGTLFISSMAEGGVMRAAPGADTAEVWIEPGANDSRSTFGVLADEDSGTLWVCSVDLTFAGVPSPGTAKGSALKSFDLRTGAPKASTPLPGEPTICNDVAIGPDGSAYVTDTLQPHILRLRPGAASFEVWVTDQRLGPPATGGGGLDGIAIGGDGAVYVNTFAEGRLFRVEMTGDGAAGPVTELRTSRPVRFPDTIRRHGPDSFLMVEGAGTLDLVTVRGEEATVETLKDGFAAPLSVAQVGDTAWVLEGQLPLLLDPKLRAETPKLPFRVYAVPLPAN